MLRASPKAPCQLAGYPVWRICLSLLWLAPLGQSVLSQVSQLFLSFSDGSLNIGLLLLRPGLLCSADELLMLLPCTHLAV